MKPLTSLSVLLLLLSVQLTFAQEKQLVLQPDSVDGKDAWVWSGERTRELNFGQSQPYNGGLHNVMRAEVWKWFGQSESDTIRSFIQFDLSEISGNTIVRSATISLHAFSNPGFTQQMGPTRLLFSLVAEPWQEDEINWQNQPKVSQEILITSEPFVKGDQSLIAFDIRSLIQEMVYFPERNYGLRISLVEERPYYGVSFASSDHENPDLRPKLVVNYTN